MMNENRITMKLKNPNPLFDTWLTQWRDKAKEKNSKSQHCFNIALNSLRKYPLPLHTGRECKILIGFSDKLCNMLDVKLSAHYACNSSAPQQNTDCIPSKPKQNNSNTAKSITKSPTESTNYMPEINSGAYAILITLYKNDNCPLTKNDIIKHGQQYCNTSFVKCMPGSRYNAWASMGKLVQKNLIVKGGKPMKYSLSDDGITLASRLDSNNTTCDKVENNGEICEYNDCATVMNISKKLRDLGEIIPRKMSKQTSSSSVASAYQCLSQEGCFIFSPKSFDVILYVDNQETAGSNCRIYDPLLNELKNLLVNYEVKHLTIGDYVWVCRDRTTKRELVLPYIVERKRLDDFSSSIKDGRYHEQKYRLKKSGIQNIYYLIEHIGTKNVGLPLSTLQQAAVNTAIQDGFYVKFTRHIKHTAKFLANFSSLLAKTFENKTLYSALKEDLKETSVVDDLVSLMSFDSFNKSSSKNKALKVTDLFVKMLIQLKGMSVDKAVAITEVYPTPLLLKRSYDGLAANEGEKLLANIQFGRYKKKIGPALSKTIFQLFTYKNF